MSAEKSQFRADVIHGFGQKADSLLEQAERDVWRAEGAARALQQAGLNVAGLARLVDDDIQKGRYDLEAASRIKQYLSRAGTICLEQAKREQNRHLEAQGRAQNAKEMVRLIEKEYTAARAQADRQAEQEAETGEPVGCTPLPDRIESSDLEQLLKRPIESEPEPPPPAPQEAAQEAAPAAKPKRTAKRKATKKKPPKRLSGPQRRSSREARPDGNT